MSIKIKKICTFTDYLLNLLIQITFQGRPWPKSLEILKDQAFVLGQLLALMEVMLDKEGKNNEAGRRYPLFLEWLTSVQGAEGMSILLKALKEKEKLVVFLKNRVKMQWEEKEVSPEQIFLSLVSLCVEYFAITMHAYEMNELSFDEMIMRSARRVIILDIFVTVFSQTMRFMQMEITQEELEPVLQEAFVHATVFHQNAMQIGCAQYESIIKKIASVITEYGYTVPQIFIATSSRAQVH